MNAPRRRAAEETVDAPRRASRTSSRQAALQVLYALDLSPAARSEEAAESAFREVAAHFELAPGARDYALALVRGVTAGLPDLDARLEAVARNWRVDRMSAVDRNILRLAAWELLEAAVPREVAIDEAIELARRFGGDASPGFVNGVLDALARAPQAGAAREVTP